MSFCAGSLGRQQGTSQSPNVETWLCIELTFQLCWCKHLNLICNRQLPVYTVNTTV